MPYTYAFKTFVDPIFPKPCGSSKINVCTYFYVSIILFEKLRSHHSSRIQPFPCFFLPKIYYLMPPLSSFILSLLSSKFGLDGSILMVHEWMKTFFISLNFGATPYPTPFGCLSWWVGQSSNSFIYVTWSPLLPYFSFPFSWRI